MTPNSTVQSFADPEEYRAAIRGADVEVIFTAPGRYKAELTRIEMHHLGLQRGWISLPRIAHSAHKKGRCSIGFLADPDHQPTILNGVEGSAGQIAFYSPGANVYQRSMSVCHWGSMSLTPEDLVVAGRALVDCELTAPAVTRLLQPPPHLMARLRLLHEEARHLTATVPEILVHPEVTRAMEQALVHIMVRCLAEALAVGTSSRHPRQPVMRRFEEFLEDNLERPIYLQEICAAIGVPERTLRAHCEDHLGMGPNKYLWLRRMNLARRRLTRADTTAATVTEIAIAHGFGELGRFAVQYRKLFGESPSVTLRRAPR